MGLSSYGEGGAAIAFGDDTPPCAHGIAVIGGAANFSLILP